MQALGNIKSLFTLTADYQLNLAKWFLFLTIFSALGIALPCLCHEFGVAGKVFLPIHFAVMTAGMVMGMRGGLIVGLISPVLSFAISGVPPVASVFYMTVEVTTYGVVAGFVLHTLHKSAIVSLIVSLLAGRLVSLVMATLILGRVGFSHQLYKLFIIALPGIIIQLALIPPLLKVICSHLGKKE
ncbi:MAG: ECF transporter S component [Pseudomonadota bacterium]